MTILAKLIFGLIGAMIYRIRGSQTGIRWVEEILFILPYCALPFVYFICAPHVLSFVILVLTFGLSLAAVTTGHGNWQDLGTWTKPTHGNEKLEFLILWLKPKLSPYWYDVVGMVLSGTAIVLPGAWAFMMYGFPIQAILIALSGSLKSLAYMIGWKVYPKGQGNGLNGLDNADQVAEFLTGLFLWGALVAATV